MFKAKFKDKPLYKYYAAMMKNLLDNLSLIVKKAKLEAEIIFKSIFIKTSFRAKLLVL
ncbi:hypothetical protein ACM0IS_01455 [Mycoplasma aquilae ATCC BAA-1896]|uniref:hypothetical protein n=1 Tax=Mycoplasma aquilae TaxID=1312741 RepID=UPI003A858EDA